VITLPTISVRQPIAAVVLLGDAKARHKLGKRLSIKSYSPRHKLIKTPAHASSTRRLQVTILL
jgi:hypothetical protein